MRNMLRWCNASSSCAVMQMTHKLHTTSAEDLFEHFTGAIESGDHSAALVHAMQIMSEASEQMKVILANAQLRAAL